MRAHALCATEIWSNPLSGASPGAACATSWGSVGLSRYSLKCTCVRLPTYAHTWCQRICAIGRETREGVVHIGRCFGST